MYVFRNGTISSSENIITAHRVSQRAPVGYKFARLHYPDIHIPNRGAAWGLFFLPEDSEKKQRLRGDVDSYNAYLDYLDCLDGFKSFFIDHDLCITRNDVTAKWSSEIAEKVFSKGTYVFSTDLRVFGDILMDTSFPVSYTVMIAGNEMALPIGKIGNDYPTRAGESPIIWNWTDNGHDFCFDLWELLGSPYQQTGDIGDEAEGVIYPFDAYDQFRNEAPEPQLVRIFEKLEKLGYIKTYTIRPECTDFMWNHFCKSDGSLDCAIVDESFKKNRLIIEQIKLLLWATPEELTEKPYFITNESNHQELSAIPGTLGGHKKLKIYGRLDCPSANKHLAEGRYAKNRVFFLTEKIAADAGYRPCAKCMPEAYKKWKAEHEEAKFQQEYWAGYEQGFYQ